MESHIHPKILFMGLNIAHYSLIDHLSWYIQLDIYPESKYHPQVYILDFVDNLLTSLPSFIVLKI